jgi:hypothetical protein
MRQELGHMGTFTDWQRPLDLIKQREVLAAGGLAVVRGVHAFALEISTATSYAVGD